MLNMFEFNEIAKKYISAHYEIESQDFKVKKNFGRKPTNLIINYQRFFHALKAIIEMLQRNSKIAKIIDDSYKIIDFGGYPGTIMKLLDIYCLSKNLNFAIEKFILGFIPHEHYKSDMEALDIKLFEYEFDVRKCFKTEHILDIEPINADIAVCTEVIEHQYNPLSLLIGINRNLKIGGGLVLTTNNAGFIGDIVKLCVGRHNIQSLSKSHIYQDDFWRPHMRLFFKKELIELLEDCGFEVNKAYNFDNPGLRKGSFQKFGIVIRNIIGIVPHFKSHIIIKAIKKTEANQKAKKALKQSFSSFGIDYPRFLLKDG